MIITEENRVVRIVTSYDEILSVHEAFAEGRASVEFEEAGGRRTIVFIDEVDAEVLEPPTVMPETVEFDGPCPFLTCTLSGPHTHPVCPQCGAVRYGNVFCATCRESRPREEARSD